MESLTDAMDVSSNSDTEDVLQDLEQINAVLEEEQTCNTISQREWSSANHSSISHSFTTSTDKRQVTKIDEALLLNKLMDEKYQKLEILLTARLAECEAKLKELGTTDVPQERDTSHFRYYQCGRPYFKDKYNFSAPANEDTVLMQKSQMFDFTSLVTVPGWTVNDKTMFTNVMLQMSQEIKVRELLSKISQLKRESKRTGKCKDKEINHLSLQIIEVKTKSLEEVAMPLNWEYDWDALANKLNHRHVTQEYRSFWKLFFHPSINKRPWSKSEHKKLQEIACAKNHEDWDNIAKTLNTRRTGYQCFVYFRTNMSTTHNGKKWPKEEVEYLKRLIDYYREDDFIPWTRVASSMENRTKMQIYNKYIRLQEKRKGRFLREEDAVILNCYKKFGNNLKKICEFLPGRSIAQVRVRLNILTKNSVSVIWTLEEDRKLLQLMSNEDSVSFYSNVTKHFPGKSREHVRSRCLTLVSWMRKYPLWDLKYAPRRASRRLAHGGPNDNLKKAVENLEERIKSEVVTKKSGKLTINSSEKDIEDAITAIFMTEICQEEQSTGLQQDNTDEPSCSMPSGNSVNNIDMDLHNVLVVLNAQLNLDRFKESVYVKQHPYLMKEKLYTSEKLNCLIKVKSYSKKETGKTEIKNQPDIWGNNYLGPMSHVLPPHYATITGCKALMSVISSTNDAEGSLSVWMRRNLTFKNQMLLLMDRFFTLFTWPMMLSNVDPSCKQTLTAFETASQNRGHKRTGPESSGTGVAIPPVPKRFLSVQPNLDLDLTDTIDLVEEDDKDNVTVKQDFTSL